MWPGICSAMAFASSIAGATAAASASSCASPSAATSSGVDVGWSAGTTSRLKIIPTPCNVHRPWYVPGARSSASCISNVIASGRNPELYNTSVPVNGDGVVTSHIVAGSVGTSPPSATKQALTLDWMASPSPSGSIGGIASNAASTSGGGGSSNACCAGVIAMNPSTAVWTSDPNVIECGSPVNTLVNTIVSPGCAVTWFG